jgi:membrane protein DedA with SNARE-associated domain
MLRPVFLDLSLAVLASLQGLAPYVLLSALLAGAGFGGPWSQDILLLASTSVIAPPALHPALLVATAWLAVLAGDALSLLVGRHYGAKWVRRPWAARFVPPERLPALEEGMRRHGALLAFVTRFLPGQRASLFFMAGTLRLPWRSFLLADGLAALVQVPLFTLGARPLGWSWQALRVPVDRADDWLTLALVLVLLAWWLRVRRPQQGA